MPTSKTKNYLSSVMKRKILRLLFFVLPIFIFYQCKNDDGWANTDDKNFCDSIHRNDSISLSSELGPVDSLMKTKTGVFVLEDGANAMITRAWLSEYAEERIDIQYFIFSLDNVGLIAADYLVRAADRGVKVRILVDDIMVDANIADVLRMAAHENIEIKIYNPGVNLGKNLWGQLKSFGSNFAKANQRMHNKTFIVDNKVVITGGRNIANSYFDYNNEYNYRDRDILLLGKGSSAVATSFNQFWNHELSVDVEEVAKESDKQIVDSVDYSGLHQYACNPDNFWPQVRERIKNLPQVFSTLRDDGEIVWTDSIEFVSDRPGKNNGKNGLSGGGITAERLFEILNSAQYSVEIQTPYLITTPASIKMFKDAVDRGVRIRILTNSLASTDNVEAFSGYQRSRKKILETGVRIFEFKPDAKTRMDVMTGALQDSLDYKPVFGLHAKSMVVDGNMVVIGTFNLDPRSANLNTECFVILKNEKIAQGVLKGMEVEFLPENAWETTIDANPDSKVSFYKRAKSVSRRVIPKDIL